RPARRRPGRPARRRARPRRRRARPRRPRASAADAGRRRTAADAALGERPALAGAPADAALGQRPAFARAAADAADRERAPPPAAAPAAAAAAIPGETPLRPRRKRRAKQWFEEIFDDDYLRPLPYLTPRQTEREAQFIHESLQLPPGGTLLDLACGYGRHA